MKPLWFSAPVRAMIFGQFMHTPGHALGALTARLAVDRNLRQASAGRIPTRSATEADRNPGRGASTHQCNCAALQEAFLVFVLGGNKQDDRGNPCADNQA